MLAPAPPQDVDDVRPTMAPRWVAVVAALALVGLAGWGAGATMLDGDGAVRSGPAGELDQSEFAGATGVSIEHVAVVGGGGLVEIRYRVLDVDRSEIVHDFDEPPRIAMQGYELQWQRHEHSHERDNRLGTTYNEQLVNLGGVFQRGDIVSVRIGPYELEGVEIQ